MQEVEGKLGPSLNPGWDGRATPPQELRVKRRHPKGCFLALSLSQSSFRPTQMNEHTRTLSSFCSEAIVFLFSSITVRCSSITAKGLVVSPVLCLLTPTPQ